MTLRILLPTAIVALFIAFFTTIQTPITIYANNIDAFSLSLNGMLPIFIIAFCTLFFLFLLPAFLPFPEFRTRYFSIIATFSLLLWFNSSFMFGHYGDFDARGLVIEAHSWRSITEVLCWVLLLILSFVFSHKIKKIQLQAVSGVFLCMLVITGFTLFHIFTSNKALVSNEIAAEKFVFTPQYVTFSTHANVVHIVLDELQSTLTQALINQDPLFNQTLDGFFFFPNTTSIYPKTVLSVPVLLGVDIYKNQKDKEAFITQGFKKNAFFTALEQANYRIDTHTLNKYCLKHGLKNCISIPSRNRNKTALILLDYSFFKAVPDMIKPKIYREERWWLSDRFLVQDYTLSDPGVAHLVFEKFNQTITVANIPPTYKFYHSLVTHSPTLLSADCSIPLKRARSVSMEARMEQIVCGFQHITFFIEKLKNLGIYDNTLIIISSDHGSVYHSDKIEQQAIERNMDPKNYAYALSTLLIKPFHSRGPLHISDVPATLADIPQTIMAQLDLEKLNQGENVFSLSTDILRERQYLSYQWENKYWDLPSLPPITVYAIQGDVRDLNNWIYKETIPEKKHFRE